MIYRRDLISHFSWLAGSPCLDEVLDEAMVAIALAARGLGAELVEEGAAWTWASCLVERFGLQPFVERARSGLPLPGGAAGR